MIPRFNGPKADNEKIVTWNGKNLKMGPWENKKFEERDLEWTKSSKNGT